jgi:hypothetical protein
MNLVHHVEEKTEKGKKINILRTIDIAIYKVSKYASWKHRKWYQSDKLLSLYKTQNN